MSGIVSDHDSEGYFTEIMHVWRSKEWRDVWQKLGIHPFRFADLGLSHDSKDAIVWRTCQKHEVVLITANRNRRDDESLEAVIEAENTASSLPVITLASPKRILIDKNYARRTAEVILDRLMYIETFRGVGRLYVP